MVEWKSEKYLILVYLFHIFYYYSYYYPGMYVFGYSNPNLLVGAFLHPFYLTLLTYLCLF